MINKYYMNLGIRVYEKTGVELDRCLVFVRIAPILRDFRDKKR